MDKELSTGYKALLYIKECAELVGLEVIEGKTAFDMIFMAEIMKRMREEQESKWIPVSEKSPNDGEWAIFTDGTQMSIERYKMDALDHFYPSGRWFNLEDAVAWMPLPEQYKEEV